MLQLQTKLTCYALAGATGRLPLLNRTGEVEATEDRAKLIRVIFKQRGDEGSQRRLERCELERESQHAGWHLLTAMQRHARHRGLFQAFEQFIEMLIELSHGIGLAGHVIGQGGAPDLVAFITITVFKKVHKASDQIGFGKDDVDRCKDFEFLGQLLNTLTQLARQIDRKLRFVGPQLGHTDRDDHTIEWRLGTVLLQQRQEAQPLTAVLFMNGVAPCRIQQDAFGGEIPIAMPRPTNALDHVVRVV